MVPRIKPKTEAEDVVNALFLLLFLTITLTSMA